MAATKEKKRNWLKAFVSIAVTLVAMPLTHILARALKDGTAGWNSSMPVWEWGCSVC